MQNSDSEVTDRLREFFPAGSTVYTVLRNRSSSGMSRTFGVVAISVAADGRVIMRFPYHAVASALGLRIDSKREGVRIHGCGMDMGFEIAYQLSQKLYGDGYALKHAHI